MYSQKNLKHFWAKVDKTGECWLWTGANDSWGYGHLKINGTTKKAHRVSLEIHLGRPIADGMYVAHAPVICHTPSCVNPAHLREATPTENSMDKHIDKTMPVGEHANVLRKLTKEQILSIREDKRKHCEIAKDYNVSKSTIYNVKHKEQYAWVL